MTTATQLFILRIVALAFAGALLFTDRVVPDELWYVVVGLAALTTKRPGDTSPDELARVLEANDPTASPRA
jgi:hypothetical protein